MGRLTTHVLDTATGRPAGGVRIELHRLDGSARQPVAEAVTNDDGRCDGPINRAGLLCPAAANGRANRPESADQGKRPHAVLHDVDYRRGAWRALGERCESVVTTRNRKM